MKAVEKPRTPQSVWDSFCSCVDSRSKANLGDAKVGTVFDRR